ncbi:MAG: DUF4190 domain-containing protein [Pyrinomonadaceae bacterium]|jgi:hypothetical protein
MKKCPTCGKTFNDGMRFCQTDGTLLVEATEDVQSSDPFKMVVSNQSDFEAETKMSDANDDSLSNVPPPSPFNDVVSSGKPKVDSSSDSTQSPSELPKFSEPSLSPPSFGDLSSQESGVPNSSSKQEEDNLSQSTLVLDSKSIPENYSSGYDAKPLPNNPPIQNSAPIPSPFENPTPSGFEPPSYKEPEPEFGGQQNSFNQTPFGQPQMPFGNSSEPYNPPMQQGDWSPVSAAPVSNWQEQGFGANTPFEPPQMAKGQDQTLAIVSLVTGILSIVCCGAIAGIPAIITGYMAKNNVDSNPNQYTGRGMALAGMIMGGIGSVFTILYIIYILVVGFSAVI